MTKARILANTVSTGNVLADGTINATEIGLGNVENKSSATIRSEITSANVTSALGGVINNIEIGNITPNAGTFTSVTIPVASGNAVISPNTSITSWLYSGKSFSVAGQESVPNGLFIGSAGTKMYVNGSAGDDVNEYTLGTAWDITTATFVTTFSTAAQDTTPVDLFFKPDGLTMMIMGGGNDTVYQYTLGTAWSVTTASYASKSFSVGTQEATPAGLWFKTDGTVMYVVGTTADTVFQYALSTAWDVSTASYGGIFYSVAAQDTAPTQVNLSNDGLKMWVLGSTGDDIWEYNLGTAWNVSTATPVNNFYIGFQDVTPNGLFIDSTAANRVYMVGSTTDAVFQYNTVTNSAEFNTDKLYTPGALSVNGNFVAGANAYVDGNLAVQGGTTFGGTVGVTSTFTPQAAINANTTTSNISLGTAQTTGVWAAGGASQTGSITLGQSTVSQTTNIQAGATASGSTKTINFGTGGLTGSTTAITLGSTFGTTVQANGTWTYSTPIVGSITGSAATLTTGRTVALTGDVTYTSESFNGSANVTGTATLASVGTAGTYTKVTTDAKGRVTSGATLAAADIPSLDASKITSGVIDAARLPSYVDDVVEAANLAGFPATGETGKIYVALDTNKVYRWSGSAYIYITSGAVDSVAGRTGVVALTSSDVGLGSVENKSSATIRGEISSANVTAALGFTPYNATNPNGYITSAGNATNVTGTVAVANGGTGRTTLTNNSLLVGNAAGQVAFIAPSTAGNVLMSTGTVWQSTARQDVMDSLAGAVTAGQYLRGNGTDVVMSAIQAADVPTLNQNTTGNAATATSASLIDGIEFRNGDSTNTGNPDAINVNGTGYVGSVSLFGQTDGALYSQAHSTSWVHQIFGDYRTGQLAVRGRNSGSLTAWRAVLDSSNYTGFAMPIGSSATNSVDVRAPIFYDSNNTAFYLDPANLSTLSRLLISGGDSISPTLNLQASVYPMLDFTSTDTNGNNRNWRLAGVFNSYGLFQILSGITPNGTPSTARLAINGINGYVGIGAAATGPTNHFQIGSVGSTGYGGNHIVVGDGTNVFAQYLNGGTSVDFYTTAGYFNFVHGYTQAAGSMRAPIFYDSNNTAFYVDPAGTSNLNALLVNGVPVASLPSQSGNSGKFLYSNGSAASWEFAAFPPTAPTNVSAGAASLTSLGVSYTQGANGTENRIYYSTTSPVTTSSPYVVGGTSSGTITGLTTDTTYYIAVATHSFISTTLSTQVTAATPPAGTAVYTSGQTLDATSGSASFLAGSGVTSVKIECTGGGGGGGGTWNAGGASGASGGIAVGIYNLSAGRLFTYYVGGGGAGGGQYAQSGYGGGASAVVLYGGFTPIVVAGGGGGGGDGWNGTAGNGGAGGVAINQTGPFVANGTNGQTTQSAGGGGGSTVPGTNSANSAANAVGRVGGRGGNQGGSGGGGTSGYGEGGAYTTSFFWAGGGGGGGYFGGAGGWGSSAGDGGGGGSSYLASGNSSTTATISQANGAGAGGQGGSGRIKITFI